MAEKIKRTERGWCGHFIGGADCLYHRNTLLEYGDFKVVVSTIGHYAPREKRNEYWRSGKLDFEMVGRDRYFETMVFKADDSEFHDADTSYIPLESDKWQLSDPDAEMEADAMHEKVVAEISQDMINGTIEFEYYDGDKSW